MVSALLCYYFFYQNVYATEVYICKGQGEDYTCDLIADENPAPSKEGIKEEDEDQFIDFDLALNRSRGR